jgi:hypothetical protein
MSFAFAAFMSSKHKTESINRRNRYFSHDACTRELFIENFCKRPFVFRHSLTSDLFSLAALRRLGERKALDSKHLGFLRTGFSHDLKWGTAEMKRAICESFDELESGTRRLKLSHIHDEPGYREVLAACSEELSDLTAVDLQRPARQPLETVFISSPYEVTPYHVDPEENFLMQIEGSKVVYVYERELFDWRYFEECYDLGNYSATLPDDLKCQARSFQLHPGWGLYNPGNCPHWVQNGPDVSVSVSIAYTRELDPFGVLRVNSRLRRLGLNPAPPGRSKMRDTAKLAVFRGVKSSRQLLRRMHVLN